MPDRTFDLVCYFDCVRDMGDPVGAFGRARKGLKPNGTLMIVEPLAEDNLEQNLTPVGRSSSRTLGWRSARKRGKRGRGRSRPGRASRIFAAPRRPRST